MNRNEEKQIHDWQEKVRTSFADEKHLYQYLFETLDNFYYRYLETTQSKDLKTQEFEPGVWGAESVETDMVAALKVQSAATKAAIMELAKSVPKAQGPKVHYSLKTKVVELTTDRGQLVISAEVTGLHSVKKDVIFKYSELSQFRKGLALKLEEVCEIFL